MNKPVGRLRIIICKNYGICKIVIVNFTFGWHVTDYVSYIYLKKEKS